MLLDDTALTDLRSRLVDVEKILLNQDRNPDDHDGYAEAMLSLTVLRNQIIDLGMFHAKPGEESRKALTERGKARTKFEADQALLLAKAEEKDAKAAAAAEEAAAKEAAKTKDSKDEPAVHAGVLNNKKEESKPLHK